MRTSYWLMIIGLFMLFTAWELNRSDSLGLAMWTAYQALCVVAFTTAWVSLVCCAVVWVYRLAKRGHEEEGLDLLKSAQRRLDRL